MVTVAYLPFPETTLKIWKTTQTLPNSRILLNTDICRLFSFSFFKNGCYSIANFVLKTFSLNVADNFQFRFLT